MIILYFSFFLFFNFFLIFYIPIFLWFFFLSQFKRKYKNLQKVKVHKSTVWSGRVHGSQTRTLEQHADSLDQNDTVCALLKIQQKIRFFPYFSFLFSLYSLTSPEFSELNPESGNWLPPHHRRSVVGSPWSSPSDVTCFPKSTFPNSFCLLNPNLFPVFSKSHPKPIAFSAAPSRSNLQLWSFSSFNPSYLWETSPKNPSLHSKPLFIYLCLLTFFALLLASAALPQGRCVFLIYYVFSCRG